MLLEIYCKWWIMNDQWWIKDEILIEFLKNKILEFSDNHENEFRVFDTPNGSELVILHPFDAAGFKAYCVKYSHGFSCNYDNGVLLYSNVKTKYEE